MLEGAGGRKRYDRSTPRHACPRDPSATNYHYGEYLLSIHEKLFLEVNVEYVPGYACIGHDECPDT